jgi:hypothetical protein
MMARSVLSAPVALETATTALVLGVSSQTFMCRGRAAAEFGRGGRDDGAE